MNNLNLMFDKEYLIENIGKIYIPTLNDIKTIGEEEFNRLNSVYKLTLDFFDLPDDLKDQVTLFDLYILIHHQNKMHNKNINSDEIVDYFGLLLDSLRFYFKDDIFFHEEKYLIQIGKQGYISHSNFNSLCNIILKIICEEKAEIEKIPTFKNARQKDIYMKIMEGRKKEAKKNAVSLSTMANIIIHGGDSYIPYDEVGKMTIYQIHNSFKSILNKDGFFINFKKMLAGDDPKKSNLDLTYWAEKLKI